MSFMFMLHYMASGVYFFLHFCGFVFNSHLVLTNPLASCHHSLVEIPPCFVSFISLMSSVASYPVYCLTWAVSL